MYDANNLPDAYRKDAASNNYRLIYLINILCVNLQQDFNDISKSRDILSEAYGATLDNYGKMYNVMRNGATDEQYRILILNGIAKCISQGDCNSVIKLIAQTFGVDKSIVRIDEIGNANVNLSGLPLTISETTGFSVNQINSMIGSMLPVGVGLNHIILDGTFEFGGTNDYDELKGFGNVEQTIGGTLGYLN